MSNDETGGHVALPDNQFVALLARVERGMYPTPAIRAGFAASILLDAERHFGISAARIHAIVGLTEADARHLIATRARLDVAQSERLWRLADVAIMAKRVFENEASSQQWLRSPHQLFRGQAPIDQLNTHPGAVAVYQMLQAIMAGGAV